MTNFAQYPKLNQLFFIRISIVILFGIAISYFIININNTLDTIENSIYIAINKDSDIQIVNKQLELEMLMNEARTTIQNNISYLFICIIIGMQLMNRNSDKTTKENKRLDELENSSQNE